MRINMGMLDNFEKKNSLFRFFLVVTMSIALCRVLIKYLYLWFPKLGLIGLPPFVWVFLIAFLSLILYMLFYRPMIMQFDRLRISEVKMRKLALNDVLTGLYNRRGFLIFSEKLLRLSNRMQRGLILIYADLDNFKQINDELGHEAGDRALVCIANVLKETFRSSDVVGRVGGDEFAILALEAKAESLDALRKRLKENLKRTKYNVDSIHKLTFSLGVIYYNPEKPKTIEELLRKADTLMYEEKFLEHRISTFR
jgi:diguanylate cyclase (GGDEF)-like protein